MARYEHDGISMDVPRDWEDRSIAAFSMPVAPGARTTANIVMTRDTLKGKETLASYADKQMVELAKKLDQFDLHERKETTLGGVPAVELRFGWKGVGGLVDQRLVMLATKDQKVLNFTATAPKGEADKLAPIFDRIFASVKVTAGPKTT